MKSGDAEGDPVVFSEAAYRVLDERPCWRGSIPATCWTAKNPQEAYTMVRNCPRAAESRAPLGTLRVEAAVLCLRPNFETAPLSACREPLNLCGPTPRPPAANKVHRLQTAMRPAQRSRGPPRPRARFPPEVQREIIGKYMAEHYRWPGHLLAPRPRRQTPRQAGPRPRAVRGSAIC